LGLLDAPKDEIEFHLWPESVLAWRCWTSLQTQWRTGMAGATGLDYAGVRAWLLDAGLTDAERIDVWPGIQACEVATLQVWAERQAEHQAQQNQPLASMPGRN
jgi:hypothetical protein